MAFAGMMTEKHLYEELGGLNESYGINEAALEFCLKVRKRGKEVLFTPFVSLELPDDRFAPQQVNITVRHFGRTMEVWQWKTDITAATLTEMGQIIRWHSNKGKGKQISVSAER